MKSPGMLVSETIPVVWVVYIYSLKQVELQNHIEIGISKNDLIISDDQNHSKVQHL